MAQPNSQDETPDSEEARSAPARQGLIVLAIDDDPGVLGFYRATLESDELHLESTTDPRQAMDLVQAQNPDLTILDITMPGINGMELLHQIRTRDPHARVVMITGDYTIETAVNAIREGAVDYVCKPVSAEKLRELVGRVREQVIEEERVRALERELAEARSLKGLIGHSPRMVEVFDLVRRVGPHFRTALILGESGSGRESIARALHRLSPNRNQRFVILGSGSLEPERIELPASAAPGVSPSPQPLTEPFDWGEGGTVFAEEVGKLTRADQSRLLQLLELSEAEEASETPQGTLRLAASASSDLQAEVESGQFRPELWYKLTMVEIPLPPLRERDEDVLLLAHHFLAAYSGKYKKDLRRLSRGAEVALLAYGWPGNVRELESIIGRACLMAEGTTIDCGDLPAALVMPGFGDDFLFGGRGGVGGQAPGSVTEILRQTIRETLERRQQ